MKKNTITAFFSAIILLFLASCKFVVDDGGSGKGVYALRLAPGDISSWSEDQVGGYTEFTASTLDGPGGINGGAPYYTDEGMVEGFNQNLSNGSKKACIFVWDFGTAKNASKMYTKKDGDNINKIGASGYSPSVARLDDSPSSGVVAYAHFGKYYIEISFTEFSDKSDARSTAVSFIEVFETKISQL
ncbi:MAG TPA: hypothetical protein PLE24_04940 [Chitinispirillaceae bacterium]|nr:hypothetical protein [Chitinispirillaceae bacterium]